MPICHCNSEGITTPFALRLEMKNAIPFSNGAMGSALPIPIPPWRHRQVAVANSLFVISEGREVSPLDSPAADLGIIEVKGGGVEAQALALGARTTGFTTAAATTFNLPLLIRF